MDSKAWQVHGKEMVDYIANALDNIHKFQVSPNVKPGYLKPLLPSHAPNRSEKWEKIMKDFDNLILPGLVHWQHPQFHAYFPSGNAYPSILADMLSDAFASVCFSWASSPSCTELTTQMLDWMGRAIGLPEKFLHYGEPKSRGGGAIQGSASDCILISLLAARHDAIKKAKKLNPKADEVQILSKLMAYTSREAHSCVEKAAKIGFVKIRILETDENYRIRPAVLRKKIQQDRKAGFIPFWCLITIGTTSSGSCDPVGIVGVICRRESVWLHIDAAYAGSALICPEFRYLLRGIKRASSFNFNPNKWLLTNLDCSLMWVTDRRKLTTPFIINPTYLEATEAGKPVNYRHYGIPLSRRFRSLKLWFLLRSYGLDGLQAYIRNHVKLAKKFEQMMIEDNRFEILNNVIFGLVCFRLKGSDDLNQQFLGTVNASGEMYLTPSLYGDRYGVRFSVNAEHITQDDIVTSFNIITKYATELLKQKKKPDHNIIYQINWTLKTTKEVEATDYIKLTSDAIYHDSRVSYPDDLDYPADNDSYVLSPLRFI